MLERLVIERFKSIQRLDLSLGRINIIIGSNNAGKSSIQQAIQFAISIAQTSSTQNAYWNGEGRFSTSLSTQALIYTPMRDVEALAPDGVLREDAGSAIKVEFHREGGDCCVVSIRKGRNKNIATLLEGRDFGEVLQAIYSPYSIIVPGLAGIPAFEEYKPPSIVRKAAAKGDSNNVFRNILLLLSEDEEAWTNFQDMLGEIFPNVEVIVNFDPHVDEHIDVKIVVGDTLLPIDSCGTGILQAIQIISYYCLYRPSLLILDEPDSHLHPNNQRILAKLLIDLAYVDDCQIIISTHSRHLFDALKDYSEVFWIRNSELVEKRGEVARDVLLELGALDRGELLGAGQVDCIVLTEDTDVKYLEALLSSSGFDMTRTQVWSYNGCSKIDSALALNVFITRHAPATQVILHRDRDFWDEGQVNDFLERIDGRLQVFITQGNDIEAYFVNSFHVNALYPNVSVLRAEELIDQVLHEQSDKIKEKIVNIRYDKVAFGGGGGRRANAGAIANAVNREYNLNPRGFIIGKIVERNLRQKIQQENGGVVEFCRESEFLRAQELVDFARIIWPADR
ncbi:AAA family ATPase [Chromobacterium vaccinii]|uniref:AAA family ATPase n=1 Tax=Chromobacterium vaccinii TaxID=1108595 RepID=UPI0009E40322|nr:ATP-binding protein [Chromobacterium vaccinii]